MNIVLIGYRGTGKSTVGRILAERLGRILVSTDEEVIKRAGCSIPEMVERHGWQYFRDMESAVCQEVALYTDRVIDTGGGAVLRPQNVAALKKHGWLCWLTAEVETISRRIGHDTQRPSLTGTQSFVDEIRKVLTERLSTYQAVADARVATENRTPIQVADHVLLQMPASVD